MIFSTTLLSGIKKICKKNFSKFKILKMKEMDKQKKTKKELYCFLKMYELNREVFDFLTIAEKIERSKTVKTKIRVNFKNFAVQVINRYRLFKKIGMSSLHSYIYNGIPPSYGEEYINIIDNALFVAAKEQLLFDQELLYYLQNEILCQKNKLNITKEQRKEFDIASVAEVG